MSNLATLADYDALELTLPLAVASELSRLAHFLRSQIDLHIQEATQAAREEHNDPTYIPPMPLYLLPLIKEYRNTIESIADVASPQDAPKSQVNNFFFDFLFHRGILSISWHSLQKK